MGVVVWLVAFTRGWFMGWVWAIMLGEDRFGRVDDASHHFDAPHHFLCCLVIGHHHWASSKEIFGAGVVFGDCVVATYAVQQLYKLAMV